MNLLPKVLMFALLAGLLDDLLGDEPREILQKGSSEYDRTNYIVIPLAKDGDNGVVLRIPQDFSGQFTSGLFWKLINMLKGDKSVMDTSVCKRDGFVGVGRRDHGERVVAFTERPLD